MKTNTQHNIEEVLSEISALTKVNNHLNQITQEYNLGNEELSKLDKQVEAEFKDVQKLEKAGLKSLFSKVLVNKEEQLDRERQEYLQATLKYNELKKTQELLEFEKDLLEKKTASLDSYIARLNKLKEIREREIMSSGSLAANELLLIAKKRDKNFVLIKEIKEAYNAGSQALDMLAKINHHLKSARQWGNYSGRSGRLGNYNKRRAIDSANSVLHQAKRKLNAFHTELRDVGVNADFHIKMENFNTFIDFFFDNLISDWIVQQKIKNTLSNVQSNMDKVTRICQSLNSELTNVQATLKDLEQKRSIILETK
jgi:DNA repair exonuclease SbcCD ATPase subunit